MNSKPNSKPNNKSIKKSNPKNNKLQGLKQLFSWPTIKNLTSKAPEDVFFFPRFRLQGWLSLLPYCYQVFPALKALFSSLVIFNYKNLALWQR